MENRIIKRGLSDMAQIFPLEVRIRLYTASEVENNPTSPRARTKAVNDAIGYARKVCPHLFKPESEQPVHE